MSDSAPAAESLSTSIPVPVHLRDLLLRLAEGWAPEPIVIGAVRTLRFNELDFSHIASSVGLDGDRLVAKLSGGAYDPQVRRLLPFPMEGELECSCAGGVVVHAADISSVELGGELTIEFADWRVLAGDAPSLWLGRVEGATNIGSGGNLIIERARPDGLRLGRAGHLRLSGANIYYLVQSGERSAPTWRLLIDTGAGVPDREFLERDFLILQFVLGRQFRIVELVGVSEDGSTVASLPGLGTRKNLNRQSAPPVPFERNNSTWVDECWAAVLFQRTSVAVMERPEARVAYALALDSYLDSMTMHVDADYLRLQVALEAFAYWILRLASHEEKMAVKDAAKWKEWVNGNEAAIRSLASPGSEDSLLNKVMSLGRWSSSRVVQSAFLTFDVKLTREMKDELQKRNVIVHQGLMTPGELDADDILRRIALVRTLLVALIARSVGYLGAINGWEIGHLGHALEPEAWWSLQEDERLLALQTYIAED